MDFLIDNFTGAPFDTFPPHAPNTGDPYLNFTGSGSGAVRIGPSGDCWTQGASSATPAQALNTTVPPTPNYYVRAILHQVTAVHQVGIGVRMQTGKWYGLLYNSAFPRLELAEVTAGAPNTANILATYALNLNVTNNTPVSIQAEGSGGSTMLTISINDVFQTPVAAATPLNLAGGVTIYEMFGNGGDPGLSIHLRSLTAAPIPSTTAEFGLYFAGSGTAAGENFAPVVYGAPTLVDINDPLAGYEYAIPCTPTDLAGFLSGKMGSVKLRRSGTQSTTPVVLRSISLKYKKSS